MSMKSQILSYLKERDWVHKGTIEREAVLNYWGESETVGRRLRELRTEGKVEKKPFEKQAIYRYADQRLRLI